MDDDHVDMQISSLENYATFKYEFWTRILPPWSSPLLSMLMRLTSKAYGTYYKTKNIKDDDKTVWKPWDLPIAICREGNLHVLTWWIIAYFDRSKFSFFGRASLSTRTRWSTRLSRRQDAALQT